jgi:hypothetical protein
VEGAQQGADANLTLWASSSSEAGPSFWCAYGEGRIPGSAVFVSPALFKVQIDLNTVTSVLWHYYGTYDSGIYHEGYGVTLPAEIDSTLSLIAAQTRSWYKKTSGFTREHRESLFEWWTQTITGATEASSAQIQGMVLGVAVPIESLSSEVSTLTRNKSAIITLEHVPRH